MKHIIFICVFFININTNIAQVPVEPFNPMTGNGARHISSINNQVFAHKLFWENPLNVNYNEIFISQDSNLVINLDPLAMILSGHDSSKIFDSLSLELLDTIKLHTKYYWRIVEYNSSGYRAGPVWYFITQSSIYSYWDDDFDIGLSNYTIVQSQDANWSISNTSYAGAIAPELRFYNSENFEGESYLILNEIFDLSPSINLIGFNYSVDWLSGEFTIGLAYSLDDGISWVPLWQQVVIEDIPSTQILPMQSPNENYVKLALFCNTSNPNSGGYWYVDNLSIGTPLTISTPPAQIQARADSLSLKVNLSWTSGFTINPSWGYRIQRKNGLPQNHSDYNTISEVGQSILTYEDTDIKLDSVYTYRIQSREGPEGAWVTTWSNEATAYIPSIVPVELLFFSASIIDDDINLIWKTSTETNNLGFSVERKQSPNIFTASEEEWQSIGFVKGSGTSTEPQYYTYNDENLFEGKYKYRLKQIDLDGSFEYSNVIEVEINSTKEFSLLQNYPNPFNPATRIQYAVGSKQFVTLKVYDVLGKEITVLVNEEKQSGVYKVEFDASSLSSGTYFYTMQAGKFTDAKKFVLMK